MIMTPRLSKLALTSHITASVGWLGAVVVFLVLAITGVTSNNNQLVSAAYLAMELSAWYVIVPLCLASLLTGLIQSLGTKWGLFKHYWIIVKLFITMAATIFLLLHMQPISYLAGVAANTSFSNTQEFGLRIQIITQAGAAIIVLLAVTTISIYKPWGKTQLILSTPNKFNNIPVKGSLKKSWGFYLGIGLVGVVVIFIIMHLLGGGMGNH